MILAPTLEYSLIASLLNQEISYADLDPKTLSQTGRLVWEATQKLKDWDVKGIGLYLTQISGFDAGRWHEYLANVNKNASNNAVDIHQILRERQALLDISNEVQEQLASGNLDVSRINTITAARNSTSKQALESVEQMLIGGEPEPPSGPLVKSLPIISEVTNGVFGMWLIGGLPAVGKSTLSLQIGVDLAAQGTKVLYYDAENGERVTLYRLVKNFGLENARKLGKNLFIRGSLRTLNKDLSIVRPPAVIVLDSIQKITTGGDDRRVGLDKWINRFEGLKKDEGYSVILISEIPRDKYTGDPKLDMFKETGALEYAADSAFGLMDQGTFVGVHCVKNRHYERKGRVALLERKHAFWFKEVA